MKVPTDPKIYHIVHIDRLPSIVAEGWLWSDSERQGKEDEGTAIGMQAIKRRRLKELTLSSYPELHVGDCVPFYFCPRSIMLYMIYQGNNPELPFAGGQLEIVHLEADFHRAISWAKENQQRWAFTDCNAGTGYFNDWADPAKLDRLDWAAIQAQDWRLCKEKKQAEFLMEKRFPWSLVERIGVFSAKTLGMAQSVLTRQSLVPPVQILREWYY